MTLQEKFIVTNGYETHFWETGSGIPLILLHGGGAGADAYGNWHQIMPRFAEHGFRVIAYDAVGFGKSGKPDPSQFDYSENDRIDQLLALMEALHLQNTVLVGNSMGGATSLGAVLKKPELIEKLVLMGTSGRVRPVSKHGLQTLFSYQIGRENMYNIIRNLTNEEFEIDETMLDYRLELTKQPGTMEAYQATMKFVQENGSFFHDDNLKKIHQKTLLVHGTNDRMMPIEMSFDLLQTMNHAWLYAIPHCGHWAMLEYPEEFARVTIDFIQNH